MAADQIIYVVGVGNRLMPTARGVCMRLIVLVACVCWSAGRRVASPCLDATLIDVITVGTV